MNGQLHAQSVFHGAIVLLIGLAVGVPFAGAVAHSQITQEAYAWRVAHAGDVVIGVMLIAIGAAGPRLRLGRRVTAVMIWSLVASAYSFVVATLVAAVAGERGMTMSGTAVNRAIFVAYVFGTAVSLLGTALLVGGAYAALAKNEHLVEK